MIPQEINVACAKAMGWTPLRGHVGMYVQHAALDTIFDPYHSIADAWVLVEWADRCDVEVRRQNKTFIARFVPSREYERLAPTAPAAICLAFLEWAKEAKR